MPNLKCDECSYVSKWKSRFASKNLTSHKKTMHQEKSFTCDKCNLIYSHKYKQNRHTCKQILETKRTNEETVDIPEETVDVPEETVDVPEETSPLTRNKGLRGLIRRTRIVEKMGSVNNQDCMNEVSKTFF
jgi:hypothetical protein